MQVCPGVSCTLSGGATRVKVGAEWVIDRVFQRNNSPAHKQLLKFYASWRVRVPRVIAVDVSGGHDAVDVKF